MVFGHPIGVDAGTDVPAKSTFRTKSCLHLRCRILPDENLLSRADTFLLKCGDNLRYCPLTALTYLKAVLMHFVASQFSYPY